MFEGLARGMTQASNYMIQEPERQARMAEARQMQQVRQQQLQHQQQMQPLQVSAAEQQLQAVEGQLQDMYRTQLRDNTYSQMRQYYSDGDVRHLNNLLNDARKNPAGQNLWGVWARFEPMTRTPEAEAALAQSGITDLEEFFSNPELMQSKVFGIGVDGSKQLLDIDQLSIVSGYAEQAEAQQVAQIRSRLELQQLMRGQQSAETNMIQNLYNENPELGWSGATQLYYQYKNANRGSGSSIERIAERLREDNPDMTYEESLRRATLTTEQRTSDMKNIGEADNVRNTIDEIAGGDFFAPGVASDPAVRRQVGRYVAELEQLTGRSLSTEDKRTARQFRSLMELGATAGEQLTDEETGLWDSMLRYARGYLVNEVGGTEGTAAYEAFRNVLRNAQFGATIPDGERRMFESAMGSLKQQTGPALTRLRTQMRDIKSNLQSIYDLNDEYVAQYYLGASLEDIDRMIEGLDARIELYTARRDTDVTPGRQQDTRSPAQRMRDAQQQQQQQQAPAGERPPLGSFFE